MVRNTPDARRRLHRERVGMSRQSTRPLAGWMVVIARTPGAAIRRAAKTLRVQLWTDNETGGFKNARVA